MLRRKMQHACGVAWRARSSTDDAPLRQDDVKGRNLQVALRYADEAQRALRPKGAQIVSPGKVGRHGDENEVKGACCSLQLVRVFRCNKSGRAELPRFFRASAVQRFGSLRHDHPAVDDDRLPGDERGVS